MFEVLKYGEQVEKLVRKCENCETIFRFTRVEEKTLDGLWNSESYVSCPCCGERMMLESLAWYLSLKDMEERDRLLLEAAAQPKKEG